METKHTKGEWIVDKSIAYTYIRIPNGESVAMINNLEGSNGVQKENEANAKLIAAAPELLDVCIDALSHHQGRKSIIGNKLREVIKKATK